MIYLCSVLLAAALLGLDQWVKCWVSTHIPLGDALPLLPGFVELRTVHNYGAAWSSFSGMRWMLVAVTCGIIAVVMGLRVYHRRRAGEYTGPGSAGLRGGYVLLPVYGVSRVQCSRYLH